MAIPTSKTDRPAIGRGSGRTNGRSPARRSISRAVANQIGIVGRDASGVSRWLNIARGYWLISGDFLLKIAHGDIERAPGENISRGIVVARLGKLAVGGSARKIYKAQSGTKDDKREHND